VVIAGAAPTIDGSLVYAVTVIQPVQTWTVIRAHSDFLAVQSSLASTLHGTPLCPENLSGKDNALRTIRSGSLVAARQQLQQWLLAVLMFPGVRESQAIRIFLTDAANIIPVQYENVTWTMFDAMGQVVQLTEAAAPSSPPRQPSATPHGSEFTMDMMMDDWVDDGGAAGQLTEFDEYEHDYRASERYRPTDEPITDEDKMEMANMAAEVEMIEDVGSLAQSLGASHIGRSLMQQGKVGPTHMYRGAIPQDQNGVRVGAAARAVGVLGSALERAPPSLGRSFNQTSPESPPRLDSFKMIKVIGKGSFGKFGCSADKIWLCVFMLTRYLLAS
jgi:PX domain